MNVVAILAGGVGQRMNCGIMPKQFLKVCDVPIIIRTLKRCLEVEIIDVVYIAIHPEYVDFLRDLIDEYHISTEKICIVNGGKERLNTIENVLNDIYLNHYVSDEDIILIHDAVRPFASKELLERCIIETKKYGATVPTIPAIDTMYVVENGILSEMPNRQTLYSGQTPDNFKISLLKEALDSLTVTEREFVTGTAQICMLKGIVVHAIEGEYENLKVTTPRDLLIADAFLKEGQKYG